MIAVDVVLEPDETMTARAGGVNARLLTVYPDGFALDADHQPHISMLQRFVRAADLNDVYAAANNVFASEDTNRLDPDGLKGVLHPFAANRPGGHRG